MKRLLIVGAGGFGRETLQWALDINEYKHRWDDFGFLDVDKEALKGYNVQTCVMGDESSYDIGEEDEFVCAIGDGKLRRQITDALEQKGAHFVSLVHPSAVVSRSAIIEEGVVICPFVTVSADTTIGKGSQINLAASIGHDVVIGEYNTICPNSGIMGMCTLEENVFIGTGVQIAPSSHIGKNAYVCMGSIVVGNVEEGTRMIGNPARPLPNNR